MRTEPLPHPVEYVIFDCDGVLVDSEILASRTVLEMLAPYGFTMDPEEYGRRYTGKVEEDIIDIVRKEYNITLPDDFLPQLRLAIERRLDRDLQPISGMKEVIGDLSLPTAVVSNSRSPRVVASLKTAGLTALFGDALFAVDMVERPKPAPDIYQYAARQLGVLPSECLVVEDSPSGVTAARRAGMTVIGFLGASHILSGHEETLKQVGAWTTVADAEALRTLFNQML